MLLVIHKILSSKEPLIFVFKDDVFTHLYTLIVRPDNTYEVKIDNEKVESGDLEADWDFLAPKKIPVSFYVFDNFLLS